MKTTTSLATTGGAIALALVVFSIVRPAGGSSADSPSPSASERLERGRYLVHQVGLCTDCHSPRDEKGAFIESQHLTGSALPFAATVPMPWAPVAPRIAGLPAGFTEADTVHFLMTGERPNGLPPPLPPMPPFRFSRPDAEAVAAYLRSLAPVSDER